MPSRRLMLRRSMVVGFFSLLGSLTGILVETTIASKLGLSRSSDTFYVAFTVPYVIVNLIGATGQFSLVPFFSSLEAAPQDALWRGFSYVINVVFFGASVVALTGAAFAPWIVRAIAPGFIRAETLRAAELCQWLFLVVIPACVAEVFRSFLLSRHRFALASGANLFRNVTVIVFTLAGFHRWGPFSMVFGYLAGVSLQLAVLGGQTLFSFPVRYSLVLVAGGEAFHQLRWSGAAQTVGALGWQCVVIAERIIASFLPPGTLTALNYGLKIMSTLSELLAGSVGTAALPALSRAVASEAGEEGRQTFRHTLEIGLTLIAPMTVFCLLLSRPIVRLVFERGNFTPAATSLMAWVFFFYSLSLPLFSSVRVMTFYLFARHEGRAYLQLAGLQYVLMVAFDLLYVFGLRLGSVGIPLGLLTALAAVCAFAVARNIAGVRQVLDRSLGVFTAKTAAGALVAALAMATLTAWIRTPETNLANLLYLAILCGVGGGAFLATLAFSRAVRVSDLARLWQQAGSA